MLMLNKKDMEAAVSHEELMNAIEEAFKLYTENAYTMTDRFTLTNNGNIMIYMPCYAAGVFGTKILAEWPGNPQKDLPYLSGLMLLNNEDDGKAEVMMDGTTLTALRTGAVGGVALRHLSSPDVKTVGLVGCGVQGLHQLCYAAVARDIETIYLFDALKKDLRPFVDSLRKMIAPRTVRCVVCPDAKSVLSDSEVIYTTTQATSPLFPDDPKLLEGKLFIAIGSWTPKMRELPDAVWQVAQEVFIELPFACEESGDLRQPLESGILTPDRIRYMGEFLRDKEKGVVRNLGGTHVFKSVGMAIYDTVAAKKIFLSAKEKGVGQVVNW